MTSAYTLLGATPPNAPLPEPTLTPPPAGGWELVAVIPTYVPSAVPGKLPVPDVLLFWKGL